MEITKEAFQELTNRVIRLENLQQDPTAYRHSSEPRAWAAVEALIIHGAAPGSSVVEMQAKFPVLALLQERMQERDNLLIQVFNNKAAYGQLSAKNQELQNELGACNASRLASEEQVDRLTAKVRQLQRVRRAAKRMVKAQMKKRVLRKR